MYTVQDDRNTNTWTECWSVGQFSAVECDDNISNIILVRQLQYL